VTDDAARHCVVVVRHGDTDWSRSGRHTGRTDIPLDADGRARAAQLRDTLAAYRGAAVLSSPLSRALDTCRLAGFGGADGVDTDDDLMEWDYGAYEGRTTVDIHAERPEWSLWDDGVPAGETAVDVGTRADRVIARCRAVQRDVVVFSHSHFLRVFAARWTGLPPDAGRVIVLGAAAFGVLGWEREQPVIDHWNVRTL
jgi:probable phosphoglycerate mutase